MNRFDSDCFTVSKKGKEPIIIKTTKRPKLALRGKKTRTLLAAALVAGALCGPIGVSAAYANNHSDTDYNSHINYRGVSFTSARKKEDKTSSWDRCYSGPTHTVSVYGTPKNKWKPTNVGSTVYYFGPGAKMYLLNNVYEAGFRKALLYFRKPSKMGDIHGVWSPDSV